MPKPLPTEDQVVKKTQQLIDYINVEGHPPSDKLKLMDKIAETFKASHDVILKAHIEDIEMLLLARRRGKLKITP